MDTIKNSKTKSFELNTTENEVFVKLDWCKTKPLKIKTAENETTQLELGSNLSGWKIFFAIYYLIFKVSDYLYSKKK